MFFAPINHWRRGIWSAIQIALIVAWLTPREATALEFSFAKLLDNATVLPGSNQTINRIDEIAFDGEYVAFRATGAGGMEGIYTARGSLLSMVADENTPTVGGVGKFFFFGGVAVDGGKVVFAAQGGGVTGVFTNLGGSLRRVVDDNMTMPGTTGKFSSLLTSSEFAIDGTNIVVSAHGPFQNGVFTEGVYLESNGVLNVVADFRSMLPNQTDHFGPFDEVDVDNGQVVFHADGRTFAGYGMYTTLGAAAGQVRTVADKNTIVPGATNPLYMSTRNWPTIDGNEIAFFLQDKEFDGGIYIDSGGVIKKVVDEFTTDPTTGDEFSTFYLTNPIDNGSVAFMGNSGPSSSPHGIYLSRNGRIHRIIGVGDPLDGKTLSDLNVYKDGLQGDRLLFRADFVDGSFGVYQATIAASTRETFPIFPTFDVHAVLDSPVQLLDGATRVDIQVGATVPERRVIMDFSLESIPPGAKIESAILKLDPGGTVGEPRAEVFGYAGNGVPEGSDVSQSMNRIGLSPPVQNLSDPVSIELDTNFIKTLLGNSSHLGMMLRSYSGEWLQFAATESPSEAAPTLLITLAYSQPLAGDFNSDSVVNAADYVVWRKTDGTLAGYNLWRSNFGRTSTSSSGLAAYELASVVPEPAAGALVILVFAWTLASMRFNYALRLHDSYRYSFGK